MARGVLILMLVIQIFMIAAWQVVIRRLQILTINMYLATELDKQNANLETDPYTDPCLEGTGSPCSFCCIVSKGECSRDIRACDPVMITERHTSNFYIMIICILSVVCGCPLMAALMNCFMTTRFFAE